MNKKDSKHSARIIEDDLYEITTHLYTTKVNIEEKQKNMNNIKGGNFFLNCDQKIFYMTVIQLMISV